MDDQQLLDLARSALPRYDVDASSRDELRLVARRSGKATVRVNGSKGALALRLQLPGTHAGDQEHRRAALRVESELCWLDWLARDTRLSVPRPLKTRDGAWVAELAHDGAPVVASIVSWVDGIPFAADSPTARQHAPVLGEAVAALHDYAERWAPPAIFDRPAHDEARTRWVARMMRGAAARGAVDAVHAAVIENVLDRIARLRAALPREPRHWGMLHGDLYPGNIVIGRSGVGLIDFSLCGFGYYVQDLGSCVIAFEPPVAAAFLESYAGIRPLSPGSLDALEACALETRLARYGVAFGDPDRQAQMIRTFPDWVDSTCRRFLESR